METLQISIICPILGVYAVSLRASNTVLYSVALVLLLKETHFSEYEKYDIVQLRVLSLLVQSFIIKSLEQDTKHGK